MVQVVSHKAIRPHPELMNTKHSRFVLLRRYEYKVSPPIESCDKAVVVWITNEAYKVLEYSMNFCRRKWHMERESIGTYIRNETELFLREHNVGKENGYTALVCRKITGEYIMSAKTGDIMFEFYKCHPVEMNIFTNVKRIDLRTTRCLLCKAKEIAKQREHCRFCIVHRDYGTSNSKWHCKLRHDDLIECRVKYICTCQQEDEFLFTVSDATNGWRFDLDDYFQRHPTFKKKYDLP
jgi:hypothetical protein